jgi:hypothetical protein
MRPMGRGLFDVLINLKEKKRKEKIFFFSFRFVESGG